MRRQFVSAFRQADAILTVSEADRVALSGWGPPAVAVPNGVDAAYWSQVAGRPDPATVLFPAALNWPPNVEAARALVEDVLPHLRARIPGARVVIAGRQPTLEVRALAARCPAATLIADPPDMRPLFAQAAAIAVPTSARAGTRLKVLQALAAGRVVVSTPEGAAGLGLEAGTHLLVAPLVEPFADALADALLDSSLRERLAQAGREAAARRDWRHCLPALDAVYPP